MHRFTVSLSMLLCICAIGLTHLDQEKGRTTVTDKSSGDSAGADGEVHWSAYRFHEQDPVLFHGGIRFMWRIGDYDNRVDLNKRWSPKCYIDQPGPGDTVVLHPTASTVTSYAWVYTW